jgi:hypothetical protein
LLLAAKQQIPRATKPRFRMTISWGLSDFTTNRLRGVVRFASRTNFSLVIPKPGLSARNLLVASGETADSSRDKAALRNDNPLRIVRLHDQPPAGVRESKG